LEEHETHGGLWLAVSRTGGVAGDAGARVAAVVARHERTLLRVARQASLCHDDALDAYQRALEIFVRRVDTVDPATEVAWLKVVVRHEAMAIRRSRAESVTGEDLDVDAFVPGSERSVDEQIASTERVRRSAEALRALKPDEAQALMMKAHGLSYEEIGARNGWTYTKVNRAITEGRRRFMRAYEGIEAGEECERFTPIVEALAAGAATSAQVLEIRPHLRHCLACRATVRDLHLSRLRRASLFWPIFVVLEPLRRSSPDARQSVEADDLVGPDVTAEELITPETIVRGDEPSHWLASVKQEIAALLHRMNASDVATGVHIATSSGGGRIASLGAMLALCLGSVGAGTVCVVTGLVPDPIGVVRGEAENEKRRRDPPRPRARQTDRTPPAPLLASEVIVARPAPTPTAAPSPPARGRDRPKRTAPTAEADPSQGTAPRSHEHAPISPAPTTAASASGRSGGQESFTPEAPPGPTRPAAAPATGGGEFTP
jgi:RNA polymerase sigma factor (sigma-70 family)